MCDGLDEESLYYGWVIYIGGITEQLTYSMGLARGQRRQTYVMVRTLKLR
jgi:hypothetical protein